MACAQIMFGNYISNIYRFQKQEGQKGFLPAESAVSLNVPPKISTRISGQNLVTGLHLAAREAGECGLKLSTSVPRIQSGFSY